MPATAPAAASSHPGQFSFVTNALAVEPAENGRRRFSTIMSSSIKDRAKNEVRLSALEDLRDAFRSGLVIYRNHDYTVPDSIFGQSDAAEIRDSGQTDKFGLPIYDLQVGGWVLDSNGKANELADAIDSGIRVGASIGAYPIDPKRNKDGGLVIDHMEAIEGSIVGIPKNQRSLVQKAIDGMATWSADLPTVEDEPEEETFVQTITKGVVAALNGNVTTVELAPTTVTNGTVSDNLLTVISVGDPVDLLVEGDLSSKARSDMPDSEFACPEKRLYPIHDAAHVRAALSRVADPNNDQCGKAKIIAAARKMGIGEHAKSDLTDDELLTWAAANTCSTCGHDANCDCTTCDCAASVHSMHAGITEIADAPPTETADAAEDGLTNSEPTPGGQEADAATPETTPEPETPATAGITYRAEDVAELVAHTARLVEALGTRDTQIAALTAELDGVRTERDRLAAEVPTIKSLIEQALVLPLRPRAQGHLAGAVEKFAMFAPEVAASLAAITTQE